MIFYKGNGIRTILSLTWLVRLFKQGTVFKALFSLRCYRDMCLRPVSMLFSRVCLLLHIFGTRLVSCTCKMAVAGVYVFWRVILQERKREQKWEREKRKLERKSESRIKLNKVHHRWLLFRIPGSWSHAVLSLYLTDPVGYELIKRNTSLDIVSTLLSDY